MQFSMARSPSLAHSPSQRLLTLHVGMPGRKLGSCVRVRSLPAAKVSTGACSCRSRRRTPRRATPLRGAIPTVDGTWWLPPSQAYFFLDTLHCLYYGLDVLFVLHHIQTFSYMLWCNTLGRGAFSVMMLMSSGEVTSPVQNIWSLAKDSRATSQARPGRRPPSLSLTATRLVFHLQRYLARQRLLWDQ